MLTEADVKVSQASYPDLPLRFWQAKCKRCGVWLTKYDDTRESCLRLALSASHVCRVAS